MKHNGLSNNTQTICYKNCNRNSFISETETQVDAKQIRSYLIPDRLSDFFCSYEDSGG